MKCEVLKIIAVLTLPCHSLLIPLSVCFARRALYVLHLSLQAKYERLIVDMRNEIEREREKSSAERHSLASQLEQSMRESKDLSALLRERDEVW